MEEKLMKAKFWEWQASLFGASFIAFALGILFSNIAKSFALTILLVGVAMHAWGMYKIRQRNK